MTGGIHILGGDFRSYYAAIELAKGDADVYLSGFDLLLGCDRSLKKVNLNKNTGSEVMILPIPYRTNDGYIKLPHSKSDITLEQVMENHTPKAVFLGLCDAEAAQYFDSHGIKWYDLMKYPRFVMENARLTAQAAVSCVFEKSDIAPSDSQVLIIGAGRIGKALAKILKGYNCRVSVSARKRDDFDYLSENEISYVETEHINETIGSYDIVINTVPAPVLTERDVKRMKEGAFAVELASYPHGINFEACAKHNIRCYVEMSLPGRYYPISAGKAIARSFSEIMESGVV